MTPQKRKADGFTLLEMMVALSVGAILLTGTWTLVSSIADSAERVIRRGEVLDREAASAQLIRDLVRRIEVDRNHTTPVSGTTDSATFTSWCDVPQGWQEHCTVTLIPSRIAGAGSAHVRMGTRGYLRMPGPASTLGLVYLDQSTESRQWRTHWSSPLSAPAAIGVVRARDTVLLVVGH